MYYKLNKISIISKTVIKFFLIFIAGGILIHSIVMMIHYLTFDIHYDPYAELYKGNNIFSYKMIPMMAAYGILVSAIYYLWISLKIRMTENHKNELIYKCDLERLSTMQAITPTLIEKISKYNNEILDWVEVRNRNGGASRRVEDASRNIAQTLQSLSRLSYVDQYGEGACKNIEDIKRYLEKV